MSEQGRAQASLAHPSLRRLQPDDKRELSDVIERNPATQPRQ